MTTPPAHEGSERLKYTIRENSDNTYTLYRYGDKLEQPNNAELQFWLEARQLERENQALREALKAATHSDSPWPTSELLKALVIAEHHLKEAGRDFDGWESIQTAAAVAATRLKALNPT